MPRMNGFEVLEELKRKNVKINSIIIILYSWVIKFVETSIKQQRYLKYTTF